jgi:hypothetical protein
MQELLKYFDPNYTAKTQKAARGNGGILIEAISNILKDKRSRCNMAGRSPQTCDSTQVVVLGRPLDGPMGMPFNGPMGAQVGAPSGRPSFGPFDQLLSRLRG